MRFIKTVVILALVFTFAWFAYERHEVDQEKSVYALNKQLETDAAEYKKTAAEASAKTDAVKKKLHAAFASEADGALIESAFATAPAAEKASSEAPAKEAGK